MRLSRDSEYALVGLIFLAEQPPDTVIPLSAIASQTGLARPFLAKIFVRLSRSGVIRAHRGRERGYSLAQPATETTARDVVEAVDGGDVFKRCVFWGKPCSDESPCALHDAWASARPSVVDRLEHLTLVDMAGSRRKGPRMQEPGVEGRMQTVRDAS
jgi:Rrf2 family protein